MCNLRNSLYTVIELSYNQREFQPQCFGYKHKRRELHVCLSLFQRRNVFTFLTYTFTQFSALYCFVPFSIKELSITIR